MATRTPQRDIVLLINDFKPSYQQAIDKLSIELGYPLTGIILLDKVVKKEGSYRKDEKGIYEEIVCDYADEVSLRNAITSFKGRVLMVLGVVERNQRYLQKLLPHVPYTLNPTETSLDWATHKGRMRQMLESHNPDLVPKVREVKAFTEKYVQDVLRSLDFPMIVKPTGLARSVLVSKVHDEDELRDSLQKSFEVIHEAYRRDRGRGRPSMIVEEFIDGDMYTVDGYVNEAGKVWMLPLLRAWTADKMGLVGYYEYEADSFLEIDEKEAMRGQLAGEQAINALGIRSSAVHIELFHTNDGWKIIELGARIGGQRQEIYKAAYGIDHTYNELRVKVGRAPIMPGQAIAQVASFNVCAQNEGLLRSIEGIDAAKKIPTLDHFAIHIQPGVNTYVSPEACQTIFHGLVSSRSRVQAIVDRDNVLREVKPVIDQTVVSRTQESPIAN